MGGPWQASRWLTVLIKGTTVGPPAFRRKARAALTAGSRAGPWPEGHLSELAQGGGCAPLRAELLICLHRVCPQHHWPALASLSTGNSVKQSPTLNAHGRGAPSEHPGQDPSETNSSWALGAQGQPMGPCNGLSVGTEMLAGKDGVCQPEGCQPHLQCPLCL